MGGENSDEIYARACSEYREAHKMFLTCSSEMKRIGEDFKTLGKLMIERPGDLPLNKAAFAADAANVPLLVAQYAELRDKLRDKEKEILAHGPLPTLKIPIL